MRTRTLSPIVGPHPEAVSKASPLCPWVEEANRGRFAYRGCSVLRRAYLWRCFIVGQLSLSGPLRLATAFAFLAGGSAQKSMAPAVWHDPCSYPRLLITNKSVQGTVCYR
jgi:hypothetical protein